jgi:hypothetical protein
MFPQGPSQASINFLLYCLFYKTDAALVIRVIKYAENHLRNTRHMPQIRQNLIRSSF